MAGSALEGVKLDSAQRRGAGETSWLWSWDGSQLEPHVLIQCLSPCAWDFIPLRQLFGGQGWLWVSMSLGRGMSFSLSAFDAVWVLLLM